MASGNITRTVVTARAYAWSVVGSDEEGKPIMERVGNVEFLSTKPTVTEAHRALRANGVKCGKQFVGFDVVYEEVRAISFDDFLAHSVPVTRRPNGAIVR